MKKLRKYLIEVGVGPAKDARTDEELEIVTIEVLKATHAAYEAVCKVLNDAVDAGKIQRTVAPRVDRPVKDGFTVVDHRKKS